jgi:hypothetical protein
MEQSMCIQLRLCRAGNTVMYVIQGKTNDLIVSDYKMFTQRKLNSIQK